MGIIKDNNSANIINLNENEDDRGNNFDKDDAQKEYTFNKEDNKINNSEENDKKFLKKKRKRKRKHKKGNNIEE